jgi:hypothetical protein
MNTGVRGGRVAVSDTPTQHHRRAGIVTGHTAPPSRPGDRNGRRHHRLVRHRGIDTRHDADDVGGPALLGRQIDAEAHRDAGGLGLHEGVERPSGSRQQRGCPGPCDAAG